MRTTLSTVTLFAILVGCKQGAVLSDYVLGLTPIVPDNQDPFADGPTVKLILRDSVGNTEFYSLGELQSGTAEQLNLPPLENAMVGVLLEEAGNDNLEPEDELVVAYGEAGPFNLAKGGEELNSTVLLPQFGQAGRLGQLSQPSMSAAMAITSSGSVYLFGGASSESSFGTSSDILKMSDPDSGDWQFESVSSLVDSEGNPLPIVGARATPIEVNGEELIFVSGGRQSLDTPASLLKPALLFDPQSDTVIWSASTSAGPIVTRSHHYVRALPDGRVLLAGANLQGDSSFSIDQQLLVEHFLPDARKHTFPSPQPLETASIGFAATPYELDGDLFCGGGFYESSSKVSAQADCTLLAPSGESAEAMPALPGPRYFHAMATLSDGRILLTGGIEENLNPSTNETATALATGWILDPAEPDPSWQEVGSMVSGRAAHTILPTHDGRAIVVGGATKMSALSPWNYHGLDCHEVFDPDLGDNGGFEEFVLCTDAGKGPFPTVAGDPTHGAFMTSGRFYPSTSTEIGIVSLGIP